jgi:hypothetical protein
MFKGLGNLASVMKNAKEIMAKMEGLSAELKERRVTGQAGGGLVSVEANGLGQVLAVRFDPSLLSNPDKELIEELAASAVNQALENAKGPHAESLSKMLGMDAPGGLGELFGPRAKELSEEEE